MINQYYLKDVDQDELQQGIYEGYIAGLNDPYSVYYDEEATKSFQESTDGEYDGIGAVMSQNKEMESLPSVRYMKVHLQNRLE